MDTQTHQTPTYRAIGPDAPLGDREGADDELTPGRIEEISNDEVRNPEADEAQGPERRREERGNRGPEAEPGFGQGA